MNLPNLNVLFLTFRLQAQDSITLPPFLGSTLRGAFGKALKKFFCFVPHGICKAEEKNSEGKTQIKSKCWFYEACPYQYIFESPNFVPKELNHPLLRGQREVPHPFVLFAPTPVKKNEKQINEFGNKTKNFNEDYKSNHFSRGEILEFSIILIGRAVHYWAQTLVAVRLMAEIGLGEEKARVPFSLIQAVSHDVNGKSIEAFNDKNPQVSAFGIAPVKLEKIIDLELEILKNHRSSEDENIIEIKFLAPTSQRILLEKEANELRFATLLKKLSERLEFLAFLHAEPSQKIDYRPILEGAKTISTLDKYLPFYVYEQESGRKERTIRRDVFIGNISYQGENINDYLPLLKAGEIFNVGTDTAHGMGRFVVKG